MEAFTAPGVNRVVVKSAAQIGKSTFGEVLAGLVPYGGCLTVDGQELSSMEAGELRGLVTRMGHAPELLHATLAENVALGGNVDVLLFLQKAELGQDIESGALSLETEVFADGRPLSGGQQARLAFARTLAHAGAVVVLDDPFASVFLRSGRRRAAFLRKSFPLGSVRSTRRFRLAPIPATGPRTSWTVRRPLAFQVLRMLFQYQRSRLGPACTAASCTMASS